METKQLTQGLSVTSQISSADVELIREAGFRSIVCNRPDGEGAGQPERNPIVRDAGAPGKGWKISVQILHPVPPMRLFGYWDSEMALDVVWCGAQCIS